ncbi:MAG: D-alanyl-D-alanine carboxypeptidase family protein [Verrucomicrobia bacterium]|nr:D-alanyl-D-alanine carboxypeptidase family protein [Verrucomicrobiota bacterium]
MRAAAAADGVELLLISAFRGFERQAAIIQRKLDAGQTWDEILRVSALPGFSEHHTGRAIDLGAPGSVDLTEDFEQTPAFGWLRRRARDFRFRLSFPRGNRRGLVYEPWHWCWHP